MLVLISGPSGAGKSTLVHRLLADVEALEFSVSTTTRPIRPGETEGVDYHFVDDAEFDRLLAADAFIEWAHVHDRRYGTRRDHVQAMIDAGRIPLLDLDVQGGKNVIDLMGDGLVSIFLFPPSWEELERRLRGRGTDADEVIATRLRNARWEVGYAEHYRYWLVNDDVAAAADRFRAILTAEACRRERAANPLPPTSAQT
ncbi:MAG TPA: guanylate kinase [Candidatus Krumholzibacteria bacterium]|nr:guanylate kinase [Candidatus Krumholzibacteria bacterium]HRX50795.1 guanylate kinase [Candidatus Krumholzibacteria bacterium]